MFNLILNPTIEHFGIFLKILIHMKVCPFFLSRCLYPCNISCNPCNISCRHIWHICEIMVCVRRVPDFRPLETKLICAHHFQYMYAYLLILCLYSLYQQYKSFFFGTLKRYMRFYIYEREREV